MRTTIELPDELYRSLKARAALSGVSFREMVMRLIEQGLQSSRPTPPAGVREPPPVIVQPRGVPIQAVPREEIMRIEEAEDEAKHARSA